MVGQQVKGTTLGILGRAFQSRQTVLMEATRRIDDGRAIIPSIFYEVNVER
jgi:hypothetical protein